MTTPERANLYIAQHLVEWENSGYASYNPRNKPLEELPFIYGFNNGGSAHFLHAQLVAEDGTPLGSHLCSSEGYMPYDLGVFKGSRPDRHKTFREHYPDGYLMEFVGSADMAGHTRLQAAIAKAIAAYNENDKINKDKE